MCMCVHMHECVHACVEMVAQPGKQDVVVKLPPFVAPWKHFHTGYEVHYDCAANHFTELKRRLDGGVEKKPKFTARFCRAEESIFCGVEQYYDFNPLDHIMCPLGLGIDLDFINLGSAMSLRSMGPLTHRFRHRSMRFKISQCRTDKQSLSRKNGEKRSESDPSRILN